ncbi:MAG: hypothetical protein QGG64_24490, partial [Candidatus Latescibacteria bacterium]|nr:hypothetical protein [Candidatus Latescibacterota bacterium]
IIPVFLFGACSRDLPGDANGLRALANGIEAEREEFEKAYNNWGSGDVASSFTVFLDGGDVVLIDEHMTRGESGRSVNRFYFSDDVLFCYREKRTNQDSTVLEIALLFNKNGEVVEAKQLADGTPSTVADYVALLAKKHAKTLHDLAGEATRER